ncbi:Trk system potassium transporter TrkA [Advenella sp. WQ 585]|uniref:Trk system potassium uptake protein TrkA n=1 Tax=Advenella mandrilli TaxID=2800330 RepID=A0ABS1EFM3_9BURK|nr:Trk system potassium transporter TrkA [Advenella mandrilli]MBK1780715.1 Trk system potassium transporter TrkA [Advenella mandrilli]
MKILIIGAGRVGSSVAENLVSEQNDITVVDTNPDRLTYLQERFDLRCVLGDGSLPDVLEEAGADDTDLLVACAATDAANLVACTIARDVFNIPRRIVRVRGQSYSDNETLLAESFGVDFIISPEKSVTQYLYSLIEFPEALQVVEFAQGRVSVVILKVGHKSSLIGHHIDETHLNLPNLNTRILEVMRGEVSISMNRVGAIQANDELVLAIDTRQARESIASFHKEKKRIRSIMIAGGGNIGYRLAKELAEDDYNIRIIESNKARCEWLASMLPENVLVLHGNGTDESLLESENIAEMDTWLALTNDDEDNIMSSLLAKRLGARKVIALISRQAYGELMQGSMIDIAVSPAQATIGALLRDVRQGAVVTGHRLRRGAAEVIEFEVLGDISSSKLVDRSVKDIQFPKSSTLAVIFREGYLIMPEPDTVIRQADHVIVYAANRETMKKVEKMFQVSAMFF